MATTGGTFRMQRVTARPMICVAYVRLGNGGQIRKLEIKGSSPRKQALLTAEVANHHGRIDRRASFDVADGGALITLVGNSCCAALRMAPVVRCDLAVWPDDRSLDGMPTSVDKHNRRDYVNSC